MALWVGALLALAVGFLGRGSGLDRDRAFYPVVTIVVAHYYALFAVMGASTHTLIVESLVGAVFLAAAVSGFKSSLWVEKTRRLAFPDSTGADTKRCLWLLLFGPQ